MKPWLVSMKPNKGFQVSQKNYLFSKIHYYIEQKFDQCGRILQRYSRVFFKKGSFFETLELFKITKVCARQDPKVEQNLLKNSVFLKKNRPGWSNFFVKSVIFLLISRIFAFFRVPGSCNFGKFDGFAAKWSFVKITLVYTPSFVVKLTFKFCYCRPAFRTNIKYSGNNMYNINSLDKSSGCCRIR